jgi:hypothetical protein
MRARAILAWLALSAGAGKSAMRAWAPLWTPTPAHTAGPAIVC